MFKKGDKVTWTKEGIDRSHYDYIDAALVRNGEILEVINPEDTGYGIIVKDSRGYTWPANPIYLQKVG